MATFLYRCPSTGLMVQGWVVGDPTRAKSYEAMTCTACMRIHLVNPKTGKVVGADEK
jgi:hypothetical protein